MTQLRWVLALLALTLTPLAFAHEGHGNTDALWAHFLVEPVHSLVILTAALVIGGIWRQAYRRQHARVDD
jgi:hydrogenase/urease accessory protein HupE